MNFKVLFALFFVVLATLVSAGPPMTPCQFNCYSANNKCTLNCSINQTPGCFRNCADTYDSCYKACPTTY